MSKVNKSIFRVMFLIVVGMIYPITDTLADLQQRYSDDDWSGKVDWEEGYVYATGIGTVNMAEMVNDIQAEQVSKTTAKHLAYRALYEMIGRIDLDSSSVYRKQLMEDDVLKIETQGQLRDVRVYKEEFSWTSNGSPRAVVTVRMSINGGLSKAAVCWANRQPALPAFEDRSPVAKATYTGLIIDARDTDVRPCVCPKILTDEGTRVVYGPASADPGKAMDMGFAAYARSLDEAEGYERAGSNPLVIKAVRSHGSSHGDLIISEKDALKVLSMDMDNRILKECRVIIIAR